MGAAASEIQGTAGGLNAEVLFGSAGDIWRCDVKAARMGPLSVYWCSYAHGMVGADDGSCVMISSWAGQCSMI